MRLSFYRNHKTAFTLVELLVVLSICSLLLGILLPALSKARRSVRSMLSKNNQRLIVIGVLSYSSDNDGRFPDSVAKLGPVNHWSWQEPTILAGFRKQTPTTYRSVSEYLKDYIESSSTMFCQSSPSKYQYAQEAWDAGDKWDNPMTSTAAEDPLFGTYCLYWNYIGYLADTGRPFVGPQSTSQQSYESKLLISDYFGYGHWRNELAYGTREAYGSCEKFNSVSVTPGTSVSCDFWSQHNRTGDLSLDSIAINLSAGFVDGRVETYTPADVKSMKISIKPDGTLPYPDHVSPGGTFYIPR